MKTLKLRYSNLNNSSFILENPEDVILDLYEVNEVDIFKLHELFGYYASSKLFLMNVKEEVANKIKKCFEKRDIKVLT